MSKALTVVGLGEALFDRFGEDRVVLGGAPLNLAVHAHQLLQQRGEGVVASSIGEDELGKQLKEELSKRGMTTDYLTLAPGFSTGTVDVEVAADGGPSYEIKENVAWDHLEFTEHWAQLADTCSAVCFGTLAQRSLASRAVIQELLIGATQALKICDLNLRQTFYSPEIIDDSLRIANVLKLNDEELDIVSKALDIGDPVIETVADPETRHERPLTVDVLIHDYELELLVLTQGEAGTTLFSSRERYSGIVPKYAKHPHADTVGAGDACCAAIIVGLLLKKPLSEIVDLANHVGAYVASRPGATPKLPQEILALV